MSNWFAPRAFLQSHRKEKCGDDLPEFCPKWHSPHRASQERVPSQARGDKGGSQDRGEVANDALPTTHKAPHIGLVFGRSFLAPSPAWRQLARIREQSSRRYNRFPNIRLARFVQTRGPCGRKGLSTRSEFKNQT